MQKKMMRIMSLLLFLTFFFSCCLSTLLIYREFKTGIEREVKNESFYLAFLFENMEHSKLKTYLLQEGTSRVTWIGTDGQVLYDNRKQAEWMENHTDREEVFMALEKGSGEARRMSKTLEQQTYYYAVRLSDQTVLRVASTTNSLFAVIQRNFPLLFFCLFLFVFLVFLLLKKQTRRLILPINQLNLERPLENDVYEELSPLLHRLEKQNQLLEKQYQTLREKQEEFRAITDHMKEALLVLNPKAMVLSINKAALSLFSMENPDTTLEQEVLQRHILAISRNQAIKEASEEALSGHFSTREFKMGERFYEIISSPVLLSEKLLGAVLLIIDITEKQKGEQMRREFAANVSHELKTPLTSISGYAELLKCGMVKEEDQPRFAETIYQEAGQMIRLIEDIIWLSKLDEGNVDAEYEEVELYPLAKEVLRRLETAAEKKKVSLDLNGKNIKIYGIRRILEEILYNLCDNAIKYNKDAGKVFVRIREQEDWVIVSIADTGIGIEPNDQERIFERFYRADKSHSKQIKGTGLGLSIVKHGMLLHKGSIQLESTLGKGSKIQLFFSRKDNRSNVANGREVRKIESIS